MREIQHATKRTKHVVEFPNLVEIQLESYRWFLEEGLNELFASFSPIKDFTEKNSLSLKSFTLGEPKYSIEECRDRDATFESPIKAKVEMQKANGDVAEVEVYIGDLPLMTDKGTFIINGAERVVVSQLARSPGVYFKDHLDISGKVLYYGTVIPQEGSWMEAETDKDHVVSVKIGQTKKCPVTLMLRALSAFADAAAPLEMTISQLRDYCQIYEKPEAGEGEEEEGTAHGQVVHPAECNWLYPIIEGPIDGSRRKSKVAKDPDLLPARATPEVLDRLQEAYDASGDKVRFTVRTQTGTTEEILKLFCKTVTLTDLTAENLTGRRPVADIVDAKGKVLVLAGRPIGDAGKASDKTLPGAVAKLELPSLEVYEVHPYIEATLLADGTHDPTAALIELYKKIRPGDPATIESATSLVSSIFYDKRRYDLARVGRYKLNKKLGSVVPETARTISREDVVSIVRYMLKLVAGEGSVDDIDHLENKRVRSVGELLASQLRMGFLRMEKVAKERMTQLDPDQMNAANVLSVKPVSASIRSFFGSSQLSQFMDQTNPLAELTAKRRLSALGPGGLSRQSAKLEVRDVHHSHYGRICPIETPEGPNIGLIGSMAVFGRVDRYGFLETPYRKVVKGRVTDDIEWMTADIDHGHHIAPANTPMDDEDNIVGTDVQVRFMDGYPFVKPDAVEYMDVAPLQLISIATAMIPFIENDEATRALMGSNMQRQSVPTLRPSAPLVKTGLEGRTARDSGAVILARNSGVVTRVTADEIDVTQPGGKVDNYRLVNLLRSNNSTCITQRPLVDPGQHVRQGQVLTDGPCTDQGELALGQNVLVAFMPWGGYNYEDAILVSERLVKDDVFTSIHIDELDREARDTKLGPEEITRDIPNVGDDALKDLDADGIIRVGAEVRADDILVGEVAPKGQGDLSAEERLIIAIFGKKAEETRDVSLRVPHGTGGRVVDVKVFSRYKYQGSRDKKVYNFCKRPDATMRDSQDGELLRLPPDELNAGVNMLVRVYFAQKRKLMEGDKMAGRHGNKGVISKILPVEDMPFLPDGTPVDIVLNPLGVPSRMNIGQVLETHLGYVGSHLNCSFVNPAFEGSTEKEIVAEMERLSRHFMRQVIRDYVNGDLQLGVEFDADADRKDLGKEAMLGAVEAAVRKLGARDLERLSSTVAGPEATPGVAVDEIPEDARAPAKFDYDALMKRIAENAWNRSGFDPHSGKTVLRDGLTGDQFSMPVTVGMIYMLKLAHLVDDKIHARSTGPYSLVTQQPLGGKAQFGGQRFGEMEVWALEAYGAAYTLQEILTIKSDDVHGRVKTYESIVKGDNMLEPGVPESFKILVNELQSLALKVTVLDETDKEIDLRDRDDDIDPNEDPVRAAARIRERRLGLAAADDGALL